MLCPPAPGIHTCQKCAPVRLIAFLAGAFLLAGLLLPVPAPALDMTLYNTIRTQEINWMGLRTTDGSVRWTTNTLPGGMVRYKEAVDSRMARLTLDMGLTGYTFKDFSAVAGRDTVSFNLTLETDGTPVLVLREDESVRITGTSTNLLTVVEKDTGTPIESTPELAQVAAVTTMAEASELVENTALNKSGELLMTLHFADQLWRGTLVPDKPTETFAGWDPETDGPTARPAVLNMYGRHTDELVQSLMAALTARTFRLWTGGLTQGPDKTVLRSERVAKMNLSPKQEQELAADLLAAARGRTSDDEPVMEANLMLIPEELYTEALSDKQDLNPGACVMVRVNSTECVELRWFYDCRSIIAFSR